MEQQLHNNNEHYNGNDANYAIQNSTQDNSYTMNHATTVPYEDQEYYSDNAPSHRNQERRPDNYNDEYMDTSEDYPEDYYQPNNYDLGYEEPQTIDYENIMKERAQQQNNTQTQQDTLKQKLKINNENFVMLALLASVVLTSVIIGIGWSLFSPKAQEITVGGTATETTLEDAASTSANNTEDLVIVYGSNSNENQLADTVTTEKTPVQVTPKKTPVKKAATQTAPISSSNVNKDAVVQKQTAAAPLQKMYWIQVFSTTNKDRSIQIKKEFESLGLTPTIITKTLNSKVYYRLRIGPYYNKAESQKFLGWVRANSSYKDAYVSSN